MKNHGAVPAIDVRSIITCRINEQVVVERPSRVPHVLFPGEERAFRARSQGGFTVEPSPPGLNVEARVDYRSTAGREYFTKFFLARDGSGWRMTQEEIGEVPLSVRGSSASGE